MRWLAIGASVLPLAGVGVLADAPPVESAATIDYAQLRLGRPGQGAGLLGPRFPEDVYAQPAFDVVYDTAHPVRRSAAIALLEGPASHHRLFRSGRAQAHLCHIPQPRAVPPWEQPNSAAAFLHQHVPADQANNSAVIEKALDRERQRVIVRGLELLEPMKQYCIYLKQPTGWFTYSFCHGKAVRQFRAKPETSAALISAVQKHMESSRANGAANAKGDYRLVGGFPDPTGQGTTYKFAISTPQGEESFVYVTPRDPLEDTSSDSYVLGRWNLAVEHVAGTGLHFSQLSQPSSALPVADVSDTLSQGTELIEVVRLGTGGGQRYLSQLWVDGTRCILNDERRIVEIQYHCTEEGTERIALIKEVTKCNYVLVIETPRLCAEPAFLVGQQDAENYVTCREIVSDDWQPPPPQPPKDPVPSIKPSESKPSPPASLPSPEEDTQTAHQTGQLVLAPPQDGDAPAHEPGTSPQHPVQNTAPDAPAAQAPRADEEAPDQVPPVPFSPPASTEGLSGERATPAFPDATQEVRGSMGERAPREEGEELVLTFLGLNEDGEEEEMDFVVAADELDALGMGHLLALTEDGNNAEVEIGWDLFEYLQERERLNEAQLAAAPPEAEGEQDQQTEQAAAQEGLDTQTQLMTKLVDAIGRWLEEAPAARRDGADEPAFPEGRNELERDAVRNSLERVKESFKQRQQQQQPDHDRTAGGAEVASGKQGLGPEPKPQSGGKARAGAAKAAGPEPLTKAKPLPARKAHASLYERISVFYQEDASAAATGPAHEAATAPRDGGDAPARREQEHGIAEGDAVVR